MPFLSHPTRQGKTATTVPTTTSAPEFIDTGRLRLSRSLPVENTHCCISIQVRTIIIDRRRRERERKQGSTYVHAKLGRKIKQHDRLLCCCGDSRHSLLAFYHQPPFTHSRDLHNTAIDEGCFGGHSLVVVVFVSLLVDSWLLCWTFLLPAATSKQAWMVSLFAYFLFHHKHLSIIVVVAADVITFVSAHLRCCHCIGARCKGIEIESR